MPNPHRSRDIVPEVQHRVATSLPQPRGRIEATGSLFVLCSKGCEHIVSSSLLLVRLSTSTTSRREIRMTSSLSEFDGEGSLPVGPIPSDQFLHTGPQIHLGLPTKQIRGL